MLAGVSQPKVGENAVGAVNPELLSWHESGAVLLMIILGGIGSLRGAVIGAAGFTLLKDEVKFPFRLQCEQFKVTAALLDELRKLPHAEVRFNSRAMVDGWRSRAAAIWRIDCPPS